jgi:glycosyltransferase involved in cell wall biosynthesis
VERVEFTGVYETMTLVKKKRRILFLFAHLHKGGMQRAVSNISLALPDDFEQYVGFFGTENPDFKYKATLHDFGLSGAGQIGLLGKLINGWHRLRAIRSFVILNQIDVVVSFGESANVYNILSSHRAKKIISSRVDLKESLAGVNLYASSYRMLVKVLYPRADMLVAVSEELGQQMRRIVLNQDKVTVIPNLYHIEEIGRRSKESLPMEMAFLEKKRFILNVGSLCYQKGQDDLLTIFSGVHRHCDDLLLVIMGRGEWKEQLFEQAISLGVSDRVVFVDFDANPYRYMARALVFVLTSRYEGFPNALVEAMICGAPVVAFDCPTGPSEILGDSKYGVLVVGRSIQQATQAICALIDDDSLNMKLRLSGVLRAKSYSPANVINKWVQVMS